MKIIKNKKAVNYAAMFSLIVMSIGVFMMISVMFDKGSDYSEPIGEIQAGIIKAATGKLHFVKDRRVIQA